MKEIQPGDMVKCIFNQVLPGNDKGPALKLNEEYIVTHVMIDGGGNSHIGVGLPLTIGFVRSYATGEELPPTQHWCHPNRFIIVNQ